MRKNALVGIGLGISFFMVVFGGSILLPQNINWLLQPGNPDSIQHLIGWEFFRSEPWRFPLGVIQSYGFPVPTSVVYTDSIPLMALLAKCFQALLPEQHQYFGLWLLICFGLQGLFAWFISQTIHQDMGVRILITCFFVMSPILLNRTVEHQALAAQWVLLASLWLYLQSSAQRTGYLWIALSICSLMIHMYLTAMVLLLECAFIYKSSTEDRTFHWRAWLVMVIEQGILLLIVAWLAGYFVVSTPTSWGLPGYLVDSMNLLAPFIPTNGTTALPDHWSIFQKTLKLPLVEQGDEGFNYLGLGFLILLLIAIAYAKNTLLNIHWKKWMPLCFVCVLFTIYALSSRLTCASYVLFEYTNMPWLKAIASVFRASGRFFWPVYYILMFATFMVLSRYLKKNTLLVVLSMALVIQIADLSEKLKEFHQYFAKKEVRLPVLPDALTMEGGKKFKHLVFLPYTKMPQVYIPYFQYYVHFAAQHHMTVNIGYFARFDTQAIRHANQKILELVLNEGLRPDSFYVMTNPVLMRVLNIRSKDLDNQILSLNLKRR